MAEQQGEFAYEDVYVYEATAICNDKGLSALAVTSSGDVYGAGYNSLVRTAVLPSKYPMLEGGADKLDKWIKVTQLCGLGIRKVVVGVDCGAALTQANEVLIWGTTLPKFIGEESVVVQEYQPNVRCEARTHNHDYTAKALGGAELSLSEYVHFYPTRTSPSTPQENLPVERFVQDGGRWVCGNRGKASTNSAVLEESISLRYCRPCDLLWDFNFYAGLVFKQQETSLFERVSLEEGIVDAESDIDGLWVLTASNKLKFCVRVFHDSLGNHRYWAWNELPFVNPHNVKLKAVYNCYLPARSVILVETSGGALYWGTALVSSEGNKYWGLEEQIKLPAPVTKVCATLVEFVCILSDKSVWIIISDMYPPERLIISRNGTDIDTFLDIAATKALDAIYVWANESSVSDVYNFQGTKIITCETDCNKVITELVCSSPIPSRSETSTSTRAELPASAYTTPLATSSTRAELAASAFTSPLATSFKRAELPASASTSPLATSSTRADLPASATTSTLAASSTRAELPASASASPLATSSTRAELPPSASASPLATSSTRAELAASATTSPLATSFKRAELPASASTSPLATSSTRADLPASATTSTLAASSTRAELPASATTSTLATSSTRAELPASATTSTLAPSSTREELPASATTSTLATSSTRAELPASASTSPLATSSTSPTEDSSSSPRLPAFQIKLYGQKQLSDMTLKLSDGDFPAHRCVLLTTSAYFQKMLSTETATAHVTRDASCFNPKAYKCLLKYFYQQQPDELDLDGLFDLYQLADSYEEEQIIKDTVRKIKSKINRYSVSHIFAMSKLFSLDEVEKYCEKILRTLEFKDQLLEKFIQDPTMFLLH